MITAHTLFLAPLVLLAAGLLAQYIRHRILSPLRSFPGPFWASITRLWLAYHSLQEDECQVQLELHRRHGSVLRISPTMLLVSDATKLPEIYTRNADKSKYYVTGSFGKTESLFNMQDHSVHAHFRKLIAGPYSFTHVKKMEPLVDARIQAWISKLEGNFASTGQEFDFAPWAVYMAYDVISEVGFGAPVGFVEAGKDVEGLIQGFHDGLPAFGVMSRLWPMTYALKNTWFGERYMVAKPEDNSGIGMLMRFRDKLLAERRRDLEEGKATGRIDLLQTFIDARDDDGHPLEDDHIKAEILLVLLAGADTTGTAFQSLMHHVLSDYDIYQRLTQEIDTATKQGLVSEMPQYEEVLRHCPYYVACIKETLRLNPSAPGLFPRLVGKGGLLLGDKYVPEGTEITCSPWLVHRDKAVFGHDAEDFRPERWLRDEEQTKMLNKYNMTFGYGSRVCLGKDIAMMELFKGPFLFLRTFVAQPAAKRPIGICTVKGGVAYWHDMLMSIEKRYVGHNNGHVL